MAQKRVPLYGGEVGAQGGGGRFGNGLCICVELVWSVVGSGLQ